MYIFIIIAVIITVISIVGYFLYKDYTKPVDAVCKLNEENITSNYIITPTPISGYDLLKEKNTLQKEIIIIDTQHIRHCREYFALNSAIISTAPTTTNINSNILYYKATLSPGVTTLVNASKNITPAVTSCTYQYPQTIYIPQSIYTLILQEVQTPTNFSTILTNSVSTNPGFVISNQSRTLSTLPLTMSVWVKLNNIGTTSTPGIIFGNYGVAKNEINIMFDPGYKPRIIWNTSNGTTNVTFSNVLYPNVWYYITFVKSSDTSVQLYVNGVLVNTTTTSITNGTITNTNFYIGRDARTPTNDLIFKGMMYNLRINSVVLNANAILDNYNKQLTTLKSLTPASSSTDITASSAFIKGAY